MADSLRLLILGAHPDDAEIHAGGLAKRYRDLGHVVKMVSLTNGDAGHHQMSGPALAERRRAEAAASGRLIGAEYVTWDHHDGQLQPTLELRWQVIREIRTFRPDLLLTHRPEDYHPDHRAVGHVVRDATYLVTVPTVAADVPILSKDPVVAYMSDRFTRPYELQGDVVIDVTDQVDTIVDMLCCHESQVFEWLPFNRGEADRVPRDPAARRQFILEWYYSRQRPLADRYRRQLIETYGPERGRQIQDCEVYEISEYASPLTAEARRRLFPFLP
jgi:LmbE family N-acetylglucosaminyl deacetylase